MGNRPKSFLQGSWCLEKPDPRPLTAAERGRLKAVETEIQVLRGQLDELDKEANFLKRIEKPEIKIQYSFGMPSHLIWKNYSLRGISDGDGKSNQNINDTIRITIFVSGHIQSLS